MNFTNLYWFSGGADGGTSIAGLVQDAAGNLFGTTTGGGIQNDGVVYKLDLTGNETVLHAFSGLDGWNPDGGVILDTAGNLYGTTVRGGTPGCSFNQGCGIVYKLDPGGNETVLHNFNGTDGYEPTARLIRDAAGNLYGTTIGGGASCGCGVVFKLDQSGNETVLHMFNGLDGAGPWAGLVRDVAGNLYGTTVSGGGTKCDGNEGCGVVFKVDPSGNFTVVHRLRGSATGKTPYGGLVTDAAGNVYGTTSNGGSSLPRCRATAGGNGCGVIFKLNPQGKYAILHTFILSDGANPYGDLTRDGAGNLYGTTLNGGSLDCYQHIGCGVVFKLAPNGKETVLHAFSGADGEYPWAGLLRDAAGNLYGTTNTGGSPFGFGGVFELSH
jgi:uncharacterized repeat protein (TIGR03803 family)